MPITKPAGSYGKVEDYSTSQVAINELGNRLEAAGCIGNARMDRALIKFTSDLLDRHTEEIIKKHAPNSTDAGIAEIKSSILNLDTIVAGNLLVAINATSNVNALANDKFLNAISAYRLDVQDALLYEVKRTENVVALTDARLFTKDAILSFNKLGREGSSVWFDAIGVTGNVEALTDKRVLSDNVLGVLGAIDRDGKLASEYSLALGSTNNVVALTSPEFLASLKRMNESLRAEVLSGVWYSRSVGWATQEVMNKISSGKMDVWRDIARAPENIGVPRIVFVGLNDGHDRGSKYVAQSIKDSGFDVIYVVGNNKSSEEIVNIARREGASAIGFSLMDDSYQSKVTDVLKQIRVQGDSGVTVFGGGAIEQKTAKSLQQAGVKIFGQGTTRTVAEFLNESVSRRSQQLSYYRANALGASVYWNLGDASRRSYVPVSSSEARSGPTLSPVASMPINGRSSVNAYFRSELDSLVDLEEEKKRRMKFSLSDMNAGELATGIIVTKMPFSQAMAMQTLDHSVLQKARAAHYVFNQHNKYLNTEMMKSQGMLTSPEAVRHAEVLNGAFASAALLSMTRTDVPALKNLNTKLLLSNDMKFAALRLSSTASLPASKRQTVGKGLRISRRIFRRTKLFNKVLDTFRKFKGV